MKEDRADGILSFLKGRIDSMEQLHVLILLREGGEKVWSLSEISSELRSSASSVELRVRHLIEREVLASDALEGENVRYRPRSLEIEARIDDLIAFYRERPYQVIDMIFSQPRSAIYSLADAFKLRKE